jgi:hypothetical protein
MRIIVCGSRTFTDRTAINRVLNGFWWPLETPESVADHGTLTIVEGAALGADTFAADWARAHEGVMLVEYAAEWHKHGRSAGPIRNQLMLDSQVPDLVIAFVNKPLERSVGTFDMVRRARGAGVPVWVIEVRPPGS